MKLHSLLGQPGWTDHKVARSFRLIGSGTTPSSENEEYYGGGIPWVNTGDLNDGLIVATSKSITEAALRDFSTLKLLPIDALVISMYTTGAIGKTGLLTSPATVNQACCALAQSEVLNSRYAQYWFIAARGELISLARGGAQGNLNQDMIKALHITAPPLPEQRAIAAFLDRETSRIDDLVAKKIRLASLLRDRTVARILQAVVGGLAAEVERAPQIDPVLPPMPSHWLSMPLRRLPCEVQTGPFGSVLHAEDYVQGAWPVINPANIVNGSLVPDERMTVDDITRSRLSRYVLRPGDVVFGRRGEMGRAALVRLEHDGWLCGTGTLRVRFSQPVFEPRYLQYYLDSATRQYFEARAVGSTMGNLNSALLLSMPVLTPPLKEQVQIADFCDSALDRQHQIHSAIAAQVIRLRERRQALITAAVTGQIDVSQAAA